jgi:ligand-binding sensor domain-containing protein
MFITKLTLLLSLLICLNSCKGPNLYKSSENEASKKNITNQHGSFGIISNSIDQNIRTIYQDSKGNYWFGTNVSGVYSYDQKTLKQFTVKDGLADNQVINIQEDKFGNLWFGTGQFGVSKFDGTKFTTLSDKLNITKGSVSDWTSTNSDLWFCAGAGVFRYNNVSLDYLPFNPADSTTKPNAPFLLSRFSVYAILKDSKANLWFGTQAEGLCKFDGKSLTWFKDKGLAGPAVLALFEDSKGNLWIGNNGAGLFRYDGKTLTNFTAEKGLDNLDFSNSGKAGPGTLARVYSINEDKNGNIWIGTVDAGVWKYDGTNLRNYTTKDGLTSNAVNTIYKDRSGELWFGTDENGICKFNGTSFTFFSIK